MKEKLMIAGAAGITGIVMSGLVAHTKVRAAKIEGETLKKEYDKKLEEIESKREKNNKLCEEQLEQYKKLKEKKEQLENDIEMLKEGVDNNNVQFMLKILENLREEAGNREELKKMNELNSKTFVLAKKVATEIDNLRREVNDKSGKMLNLSL